MEFEIGADESVSTVVVRAVSALRGCHPRALRPLEDVLDPAALDALFEPMADGTTRVGGRLSFVYGEFRITLDNGEYVTLEPLDTALPDAHVPEPADDFFR